VYLIANKQTASNHEYKLKHFKTEKLSCYDEYGLLQTAVMRLVTLPGQNANFLSVQAVASDDFCAFGEETNFLETKPGSSSCVRFERPLRPVESILQNLFLLSNE
jgi:hypothetical protein